jgi:hypothetical protein
VEVEGGGRNLGGEKTALLRGIFYPGKIFQFTVHGQRYRHYYIAEFEQIAIVL